MPVTAETREQEALLGVAADGFDASDDRSRTDDISHGDIRRCTWVLARAEETIPGTDDERGLALGQRLGPGRSRGLPDEDHGQQTGHSLTRIELEKCISSMREWCELLADRADERIGYDGFSRNSLRKNGRAEITEAVNAAVAEGWEAFVQKI